MSGFAAGNFLGLKLKERLADGLVSVTILTNRDALRWVSPKSLEKGMLSNWLIPC